MSDFQIVPQLYEDLVIPAGGTDSNAIQLDPTRGQFVAVIWPSAIDGTDIDTQVSVDNGVSWHGIETFTVVLDGFQALSPLTYRGVSRIRLKAASAQAGGARTVKLIGSII